MRLLGPRAFDHVFGPWAGKRACVVEGVGNVGDQLIYEATRQLLYEFGIEWVRGLAEAADVVFLFGGGNLGEYPQNAKLRGKAFDWAAKHGDAPVVQLPQSAFKREEWPFHHVFLRERTSLAYYPEGTLAPDLALAMMANAPSVASQGIGVYLRKDDEASGRFDVLSAGDPAELCGTPAQYLTLAARHEVIVTDRLHFAVCGLLMGRRTYLLPNSYHKNQAMFETWLEGFGCRWIADKASLKRVVEA